MKILMLTHDPIDHAAYLRSFSMARALVERGHAVTILAARKTPGCGRLESDQAGVRVIESPDFLPARVRIGGLSPLDGLGRIGHVLMTRYDIVHAFSHRPAVMLPGLLASVLSRAPYLFDWSDCWGFRGIAGWRRGWERWVLGSMDQAGERLQLRLARGITAANQVLFQQAGLRKKPGKMLLLPPAANPGLVACYPVQTYRSHYGFQGDDFIIAYSSQNHYDEDLLVETFARVRRQVPTARLLLTGRSLASVLKIFRQQGLAGDVRYVGFVPYGELGEVLSCGDVMFLPYTPQPVNLQRSPSKWGDYLCAGRPIVTNPTGEVGGWVEAQGVGLVVPATAPACSQAIVRLYHEPDLREKLGRRARHCAETTLAWSLQGEALEHFYQRMRDRPQKYLAGKRSEK